MRRSSASPIVSLQIACIFLACLLQAASAETIGERTGVNSALGLSPTTADLVREAALSAMFEIEVSKLAGHKTAGLTRKFAEEMVLDHPKLASELTRLAQQARVELPYALDIEHQKELIELKVSGQDQFARWYRNDQILEHKRALALFQRYAKGGDDVALKAWAAKSLPNLLKHRELAQNLP